MITVDMGNIAKWLRIFSPLLERSTGGVTNLRKHCNCWHFCEKGSGVNGDVSNLHVDDSLAINVVMQPMTPVPPPHELQKASKKTQIV